MLFFIASPLGIVVLIVWAVFTFLGYRHCMQQELLAILTATARQGLPLHVSVRAFAADRPEPDLNRVWNHLLLFLFLPGLNFYHLWSNYRRKLRDVAELLENGAPLSTALARRGGVAAPETVMAAVVGETTGRLHEALKHAHTLRSRFGTLWHGLLANLAYPILLAAFGYGILITQATFVAPQYTDLLAEFDQPVPLFLRLATQLSYWLGVVMMFLAMALAFAVVVALHRTLQWYVPGIAWYHRTRVRARVLEMMGVLLEAGYPLPDAFELLQGTPGSPVARLSLREAERMAERGHSPADCLVDSGMVPRRSAALLQSAQQSGRLPWALRELGAGLHRRLQQRLDRLTNVVCPLLVVAVGAVFAVACVGFFYPIVQLIEVSIP